MREKNVFTAFLNLLHVKHTKIYSDRYFNEHPHKYNLYGISKMLSDYGIENAGIKINDKNDILQIETPFIAHVSIDFVVVYKITDENVHYIWEGRKVIVSIERFFETWSGVVLIAEPDEHAGEPAYSENRKKEYINKSQQVILYSAIGLLIVSSLFISDLYTNAGLLLLLVVNLTGIYISYLLVLKLLKIYSSHSDKICSLFKQADCNDVLNSKAAKLWDIIGWSEIGLGYFMTNILIILFFPQLLSFLAIINIYALPYTFWSFWYQKFKARQWCPLCLIVQAILWGIFFINLSFDFIAVPALSADYLFVGCLYLIPMILINLLIPQLGQGKKVENMTQELKSIKLKDEVFNALLQSQPFYAINKSTSAILFGNTNSKNLITIVTNPHCEPCAKLHQKMAKLLYDSKDQFCIQYIFLDFDGMEESSNYLTAVYYNYDLNKTEEVYTEWFNNGGKYNRELFIKRYPVKKDAQIEDEIVAHKAWQKEAKINSTPTIFINGFQLPAFYQLEEFSLLDFGDKESNK